MQRELGNGLVAVSAEDDPDALTVVTEAQLLVDGVEVEVHLRDELGLELADLQFDDDKPPQGVVVEQEVEEELLVADEQRSLAAVEREARAQLEQELLDVGDQPLLEVALPRVFAELEEVEDVRILRRL